MSLSRAATGPTALGRGIAFSAVVHLALVAAAIWWGTRAEAPRPPVYRVELVGAPPGPRQAGVVTPAAQPSAQAPDIAGAERVPEEKVIPKPSTAKKVLPSPKATPSTSRTKKAGSKTASPTASKATAAPKAGAGAQGGKGADVANLSIRGIDFPYPGYLQNIVRQITLNWTPRRVSASLVSEVKFTIRRDGSVIAIEVVKGSADRIYDLDAMGAVEAVGSTRGFGPLPQGWTDDVLIVYFTFDYALRPN
ncbi:cell envelope integrity protein TolA [Gemmatimonas groenlandica]|uniref:Cell envelope integrity protein TolA n=1 Tax=Gemmatimonas groenlandica TaxID=2732249 RepID=A0A6M4IN41_9BACT|nr:cell envelope integrity protein TolA [Gemmatimonas groenlandica]QJR34847.1 cell envelope integrity protein TolA [Gemmatimonas groenlandica]